MRITCPSCSAEYEAPDEAFGPDGRVVECSDCGAKWMQPGPELAAAEAGAARVPGLEQAAAELKAMAGDAAEEVAESAEAAVEETAESLRVDAGEADAPIEEKPAEEKPTEEKPADETPAEETPAEETTRTRAGWEDALERAAAMADAKDAEGKAADNSGDNADGKPDAASGPAPVESPVSDARHKSVLAPETEEPRGAPAGEFTSAHAASATGLDAARLTAELRAPDDDEEAEASGGRGFFAGFVLAALVGAALAGGYLFKDRIVEMAPQAAPYLEAYAETVDDVRVKVEDVARKAADKVGEMTGG